MAELELHQFPYSHFNDKARWALAYKGVEHRRVNYLPGPHIPAIRSLSGQPQTPVLRIDGEVVAGSAAIIDRLERAFPTPALYPVAPENRTRALDWQSRWDASVGPAVRTALFSVLIDEPAYLCRIFSDGKGRLKRALYRASFPVARPMIAKGNGVTSAAAVAAAFDTTEAALDELAAAVRGSGYLAGDAFSVADLTAAALLAPLCEPPCVDMQRPGPAPPAMRALLERFATHPAIAWTCEQYARHRPG